VLSHLVLFYGVYPVFLSGRRNTVSDSVCTISEEIIPIQYYTSEDVQNCVLFK